MAYCYLKRRWVIETKTDEFSALVYKIYTIHLIALWTKVLVRENLLFLTIVFLMDHELDNPDRTFGVSRCGARAVYCRSHPTNMSQESCAKQIPSGKHDLDRADTYHLGVICPDSSRSRTRDLIYPMCGMIFSSLCMW